MNQHFSICIGRRQGAGGSTVGRILARELNCQYYNKDVLRIAAEQSGYCRDVFEQNDERKGFFGSALRSFTSLAGVGDFYQRPMSDARLFELQSEAILQAAETGNCIFIGRLADYVLRNHPRCLTVFVTADEKDRIDFLHRVKGMDESAARRWMAKTDSKRAEFYNFYSGKKWGDSASYDLCINSSKTGFEGAAKIIIEMLKKSFPDLSLNSQP